MEANTDYYRLFDFSGFVREKNWGNTLRLEGLNANDLHIARVFYGGLSSNHCHHNTYNFIYVQFGALNIQFPYLDIEDVELPGNYAIEINPMIFHRFICIADALILESYYKNPIDLSYLDIQREQK